MVVILFMMTIGVTRGSIFCHISDGHQPPGIRNSSSPLIKRNRDGDILSTKIATGDPLVSKLPYFRGLLDFPGYLLVSKQLDFWVIRPECPKGVKDEVKQA